VTYFKIKDALCISDVSQRLCTLGNKTNVREWTGNTGHNFIKFPLHMLAVHFRHA